MPGSSHETTTSTTTTSASLLSLCGRKHQARLGANLNESVATGPNAFARAQLEKLGWTEGTGLGKKRDGRADHVRVTKRREGEALGASAAAAIDPVVTGDQWWKSSVGNTLARLAERSKAKKKKKRKKESPSKKTKKRKLEYTDEELFAATGGARFGMRAQTQQKGKWNRAEDAITKEEEASARSKTEWDGMAAPKIVLSSSPNTSKGGKSESSSSASEASENADHEDDNSSGPPPRKKQKALKKADEETKIPGGGEAKTKAKKSKKSKKEKKAKEKKAKKKKRNLSEGSE